METAGTSRWERIEVRCDDGTRPYIRRHPEDGVLHRVLREHLETFLEEARARGDGVRLPAFVERELREFLSCGVMARGFARFRCDDCGHEILVAFSCKGRGFCPSCCGRRMAELAAHLVDDVLGGLPVRQWVLTVPHRLRYAMAWDHELCRAVLGVFIRALLSFESRRAERRGIRGGRGGAVTAIQRFGSALNLNVHFHTLAVRMDLDRPNDEIESTDPLAIDSPALSSICGASVVGRIVTGPRAGQAVMRVGRASDATLVTSAGERHANARGFDLHAEVAVPAGDRARLEHLCGYVLRPPVAQGALQLTDDGRILLTMRRPWRDGTRAILFEPHELIERLAALIPKPRINLLLYHGVVGPAARLRHAAVAAARAPAALRHEPVRAEEPAKLSNHSTPPATPPGAAINVPDVPPAGSRSPRRPHAPWADLLRRTFGIDILECPGCGGRLRFLATIEEPGIVRKILDHLGLPTHLSEPVAARSPPREQAHLPGLGGWAES